MKTKCLLFLGAISLGGLIQPVLAQSTLNISSISVEDSGVILCWESTPDLTYQVQSISELESGIWTDHGAPVTATSDMTCVTNELMGSHGFFRIRGESGFSQNAVGYYELNLPKGFTLAANQLYHGDNNLNTVFPTAPIGSQIIKWDAASQTFAPSVDYFGPAFGGWVDPLTLNPSDATLEPGEGAFLNMSNPAVLTLVGEVRLEQTALCVPPQFSIVSNPVPTTAHAPWTAQGVSLNPTIPTVGDELLFWDPQAQAFAPSVVFFGPDLGGWVDSATFEGVHPVTGLGEAVFYNNAAIGDRCFILFLD